MAQKPKSKSKRRSVKATRKSNVIERESNNMNNSVFRRLETWSVLIRIAQISKSLWNDFNDHFFT